jgi:hypothetical protein
MKIIKQGRNLEKSRQRKKVCSYCGCEFVFEYKDIHWDRNETYVICPNSTCEKFIAV